MTVHLDNTPARMPDWWERLLAVFAWHRAHAFAWGRFDCATLFSDAGTAVIGIDPLGGYVWRNEREALKGLALHGVTSMAAYVAQRFAEIPPAEARRGDVGFAREAAPLSCPYIITGATAEGRDTRGWLIVPRTMLVRTYRVGA